MKKRFKKVYIEITNVCNLNCSFCPETTRKKEFITVENFSLIIDKIKDYTDYVYLHVKGEPLMHPKLDELIDICNKNDIKVNITSNGRLLKDKIDILRNGNIRQLNISLHSFNNIDEIKGLLNVINEKENFYISYRLWNEGKNIDNSEILKLLTDKYGLLNESKLNDKTFVSIDKYFEWPDLNNNIHNLNGKCLALKDHAAILVDGTVVPCCLDNERVINLGNIYNETLQEILEKGRTNNILNGFKCNKKEEELCQHCGYSTRFD